MSNKDLLDNLEKLASRIEFDMKEIIQINGAIATGWLYKEVKARVSELKDDKYTIEISYPFYGKFIDEGRRPGKMPPIKDIADWCKIKGIPQSAAFPIAKSIGEKGFKGIHFTRVIFGKEEKDAFAKNYANYALKEIIDINKNK
jgi:hypothetical protein